MIEHDHERRKRYWNARAYFSITNNTAGEMLAEIAMPIAPPCSGKRRKQLLKIFASWTPSCPSIAKRLADSSSWRNDRK